MLSYKKVFIISASCFIVTIIFGFVAYQSIFEFIIRDQVSLHKRNYVRQFYLKYPIPLDFRVYFFNVTNPEEVHEGGVPMLKEIGPYCYDLYKERIDVEDNDTDDSLTYTPHDIYLFNQERSGNLSQDDYVTIIHPLIVGMVNFVATKAPQFLSILNTALGFLFPDNESIYLTAKVKDILFDGMLINCTAKDFSTMVVCKRLKSQIPGINYNDEDILKYSLLGNQNGTVPTRMKVLRGIKNSKDLGRLIAVDNVTKSTMWSKEECNEFRGTDGWIFPPLSANERQIWIHSTTLCMNLHADYVEKATANGISVQKYYSDFEDLCEDCSIDESCLPRGLIDLTECVKVPLYISLPHFLRSDESLLRDVRGLQPDTESHITRILLEGTLSLPMEAQIRAQFNFPIKPLKEIDTMQRVPQLIHPVLWIELGVVLNGWFLHMIEAFFYFMTALEVLKYLFLVASLVGMGYGAYLYLTNKKLYSMKDTIALNSNGCLVHENMQSSNKVLVFSSFCFVTIVVLCFVGFPGILQFIVKDQTALRKRNLMKKFYLKIPIPLDFRVYFFNITNPSEVQEGQTPVVKEIGPYCYDAYKEKIDVLENEGEDSLTYTPYETYFFNQERSGSLTGDDYVTVLHPLIVGIVNTVARDSPPLLVIVNKALKSIFHDPQDIYIRTKVRDFLFDGITINCNVQDFAATAVCTQIKAQVPGLVEVQKNVFKFSILGPRNGTLPNRVKVFRGMKKSQELGRLVELNHDKVQKIWSTKKCNRFRGTDSWIFPPFINKELGFWVYSFDLCRNIHLLYVEDMTFHSVAVEKYYADLGDMSTNPAEKCYCNTPKTCLPKGIMDLTKCMGVPIYATLPHFLRVDESVQKKVKGLNPVTDDHIVRILMQPMLGVPMEAQKRMQFNLPIQPVKKIGLMKTLPEALHPIFWIEESVVLDGPLLKMITMIFTALKVFDIVKYVLLFVSLGGVGFGGYLRYKSRNGRKITPTEKLSSAKSTKSKTFSSAKSTKSKTFSSGSTQTVNESPKDNGGRKKLEDINILKF
ncbi:hypothetical protein MTP99_012613 [Tenebrio molitor]|nr:hypothetical protein MTP99_012613 [Tenebrio molitor]